MFPWSKLNWMYWSKDVVLSKRLWCDTTKWKVTIGALSLWSTVHYFYLSFQWTKNYTRVLLWQSSYRRKLFNNSKNNTILAVLTLKKRNMRLLVNDTHCCVSWMCGCHLFIIYMAECNKRQQCHSKYTCYYVIMMRIVNLKTCGQFWFGNFSAKKHSEFLAWLVLRTIKSEWQDCRHTGSFHLRDQNEIFLKIESMVAVEII